MFTRAILACLLLMGILINDLNAQVRVYGKVYDEKDLPLQGVNVTSKHLGTGVGTNLYGSYSLDVNPGDTVVFSMLGFQKKYVAVTEEDGMVSHDRSEEHTSDLQSLMRTPYAVFRLNKTIQLLN